MIRFTFYGKDRNCSLSMGTGLIYEEEDIVCYDDNDKCLHLCLADQTVGQSLAIVENMLEYVWRQFVRSAAPETAIAYHEAAHAFMAWKMGETPVFLTIVSRGSFGGYVQKTESDRSVHTEKSLRSQIKISLAGQAGEMIFYKYYAENASDAELLKNAVNTGAGNNLEYATWYARQIVSGLGRTSDSLARIPESRRTAEMNQELLEERNLCG